MCYTLYRCVKFGARGEATASCPCVGKERIVYMEDYREIIASNIAELRTSYGETQFQLAASLNYSDKAVSKWERGESVPDVAVLKAIADRYGVSVDYLLRTEHTPGERAESDGGRIRKRNRSFITLLATALVWLVCTFLFVILHLAECSFPLWLLFIYPLPVSFLVLLIFNSLWGKRRRNFLIISALVWTFLLCVFLSVRILVGIPQVWLVFLLGLPGQIIIVLWAGLVPRFGRGGKA